MKTKLEKMFLLYDRLCKRRIEYCEKCFSKAKQILLDANITSVNTGYLINNKRREVFAISPRTGYVCQTSHLETIDYEDKEMAEEIRNLLNNAHSGKTLIVSKLKEEIEWEVLKLTNEELYRNKSNFFLNINNVTYTFEVRFSYGSREITLRGDVPTVIVKGKQVDFKNF